MKVAFARNQINGKLIKPGGSNQIAPAQSKYKGHICPWSIANPRMNNQLLRGQNGYMAGTENSIQDPNWE